MMRLEMQFAAELEDNGGVVGTAQFAGALDNGLQGRAYIRRRRCNHAKYVAAGRLVGQGLGQVARSCLHFLEHSDVLDCNTA